jgi:hypothetical protein
MKREVAQTLRLFPRRALRTALADRAATINDPYDLVDSRDFTLAEKRSLLASWASDARALEAAPALRQLDSGSVVPVSTLLAALRLLDEAEHSLRPLVLSPRSEASRRPLRDDDDDDDDDPPPAAAVALPRPPAGGGTDAAQAPLQACA